MRQRLHVGQGLEGLARARLHQLFELFVRPRQGLLRALVLGHVHGDADEVVLPARGMAGKVELERLGYRRFVGLSLLVFGLGSGVCATSPADGGVLQLALGRLLQGLGGSTFFVAGRMLINELPPERRFHGLLTFVSALLGGTALAPLLAAALLGLGGWRALFWFGLVWAVGVAWAARGCLPSLRSAPHERSQEHWGWLLVVLAGVCGLQWVIQQIPVQQAGAQMGFQGGDGARDIGGGQ